ATPEDTEPGDTADTAAPEDTTPPQDTAPACASRATTLAGGSGQKVVIEAVRFGASTDVAIVRNVSASPVTITSAWQWCSIPDYGGVTAASVTLQPQESMQFTLPIPIGAADELALYHSSTYGSSTDVEAFVQWGSAQSGRVGTAVTAGYWSANADFIAIEAGDDGFIATGAASAAGPGGFESVAPACPLQ
ncbi:MAG: hypothetical protein KC635_27575, partial [Myxococcales bacterium]|nr:hypothetical protein [Myxococcales bacterium]